MGIFGPSLKEVWAQLSEEINGDFTEGGIFSVPKVIVNKDYWAILLDTYTVSTGKTSATYTRFRAAFLKNQDIYFKIYKEGIFSDLAKMLGMQDIEIGIEDFDNNFVIKGNNEESIKNILSITEVRNLIQAQDRINLEIKESGGFLGPKYPEDVAILEFTGSGVIKDIETLKSIFKLFEVILNRMADLEIIQRKNPNVEL
ncbi:hypothetical protein GCM10008905_29470 [Clostridium malenominatum]|uniref:DUF3137 domain-containing protein n=1 Tax=Clostridium malenominatum TaxID=1539 RepID=A0ABP3UFL4_9CLOT